jgi:hypothetical protein
MTVQRVGGVAVAASACVQASSRVWAACSRGLRREPRLGVTVEAWTAPTAAEAVSPSGGVPLSASSRAIGVLWAALTLLGAVCGQVRNERCQPSHSGAASAPVGSQVSAALAPVSGCPSRLRPPGRAPGPSPAA